jgi:hypothetical protein
MSVVGPLRGLVPVLLLGLFACTARQGPTRAPAAGTPETLRTGGVYRTAPQTFPPSTETFWGYLRFYDDGLVIATTSSGTPADLRAWFTRERSDLPVGRVVRTGDRITFSTKSVHGVVDYDGRVEREWLRLSFHSQINGNRGDDAYAFVPWPDSDSGSPR